LRVAVAEKPVLTTVPPREELPGFTDGKDSLKTGTHAAHPYFPEPFDDNRPERNTSDRKAPAEDTPRFRHGETAVMSRCDAAHAFEPLH
jgi:hypothetical protein